MVELAGGLNSKCFHACVGQAHVDAQVLVGHPHLVVRLGAQVDEGSAQVVARPDPVHEQGRDEEGIDGVVRLKMS